MCISGLCVKLFRSLGMPSRLNLESLSLVWDLTIDRPKA